MIWSIWLWMVFWTSSSCSNSRVPVVVNEMPMAAAQRRRAPNTSEHRGPILLAAAAEPFCPFLLLPFAETSGAAFYACDGEAFQSNCGGRALRGSWRLMRARSTNTSELRGPILLAAVAEPSCPSFLVLLDMSGATCNLRASVTAQKMN